MILVSAYDDVIVCLKMMSSLLYDDVAICSVMTSAFLHPYYHGVCFFMLMISRTSFVIMLQLF